MAYIDEVEDTFKEIVTGISVLAGIGGIVGAALVSNKLAWLLGTLLAIGTDILLLRNMINSLDRAVDCDPDTAKKMVRRASFFRYMIIIIVMLAAIRLDNIFNIWSVLLGIFYLKFAALLQPLTHKALNKFINKGR